MQPVLNNFVRYGLLSGCKLQKKRCLQDIGISFMYLKRKQDVPRQAANQSIFVCTKKKKKKQKKKKKKKEKMVQQSFKFVTFFRNYKFSIPAQTNFLRDPKKIRRKEVQPVFQEILLNFFDLFELQVRFFFSFFFLNLRIIL
eukprot:TRINITY_DN416_c0_g1_i2.p3 TRINITY_DN416_c0_g1~~TRINITY_DN416_c0_g1_i2.p3  ORF type:complete len:142 (-),score=13.36 TRINITY_DN416_c0_g1_i2:361-786(-)